MKRKSGGYLTVFLALSLTAMLSLILTMAEAARIRVIRARTETVTDTAVCSVLSEFSRELFEQYDLLFVDAGYGGAGSLEHVRDRLEFYLKKNYETTGISLYGWPGEFSGLQLASAGIPEARFAADSGGAPVREQIYAYMAADPAGAAAAKILAEVNTFQGLQFSADGWMQQWSDSIHELQEAKERARREREERLAQNPGADDTVVGGEFEDPTEEVLKFRLRPVLLQVLGNTDGVSGASVNTGSLLSHREKHFGNGGEELMKNSHGYLEADAVVMDEYIMEKCGCYRENEQKMRLKYQTEYVLFGKDSDADNLEKAAQTLLLVRYAADCAYIMTDEVKTAEADTAAAIISTIVLLPEIQPVLKNAILLTWAYLECVQDVRTLMDGGKVPLVKTRETWKTSLSGIFNPAARKQASGNGLRYEDYLRILLFLEGRDKKTERLMDVMEMDVRKALGSESFRMDWCLDALTAESEVESSFGYRCSIRRSAGYN